MLIDMGLMRQLLLPPQMLLLQYDFFIVEVQMLWNIKKGLCII